VGDDPGRNDTNLEIQWLSQKVRVFSSAEFLGLFSMILPSGKSVCATAQKDAVSDELVSLVSEAKIARDREKIFCLIDEIRRRFVVE
jgi:hypothetical protein